MKVTVKKEVEIDVKTLHVNAGVRYWNDTDVNGVEDTEDGANIPCKVGDIWKPIIDLETGKIINWEIGKTASVHYKVCDNGRYYLKDADDEIILSIEDNYVPSILCPKENGYGDYIIMDIDENGVISNFLPFSLKDFEE